MVSLLQTVTQIQEMTLSFVPKLVGMAAILLLGGNWMLQELTSWTTGLWSALPRLVG
jgi:flagellar biosynthesis protein FliQ